MLVAFTETGSTARFVSKARPARPHPGVLSQREPLAASWRFTGASCLSRSSRMHDADAMVERANAFVLCQGLGSPGDKMVVVFGAPIGVSGTTNSVRVRVLE